VFRVLVLHVTGRRRVRGTWHAVPLRHGREGNPRDAARRALAIAAVSVSPNSVVVGVDPDRDELVFHQLSSSPQEIETTLGRSR
jgi:hypothetical protein